MTTPNIKTAAEARAWFTSTGTSIAEWCRLHKFGASLTRQILEGKKPCHRGQSHQIAVMLGIKEGVITRPVAAALQKGPHTRRKVGNVTATAPAGATETTAQTTGAV